MIHMRVLLLLALLATPAHAAVAVDDGALCQSAVNATEKAAHLPAQILRAISLVESGRPDPRTGAATAWPWTINVAGIGHFFANKADAIAAVQTAQFAGVQSIDVGCMQINLLHHPHAFANLDDAFDPAINARYAATFLQQLHDQTSSWGAAVAAYHSFTPELGTANGQQVAAIWPLAAKYGLPLVSGQITRGAPQPAAPVVDPFHVLTPEFRSLMVQQAAFRRSRDAAMGLAPVSPSGRLLSNRSHLPPPGGKRRGTMRASLND
jgi:hypothetical protein